MKLTTRPKVWRGLRCEWNGSRSGESAGELGEDGQVGVKLDRSRPRTRSGSNAHSFLSRPNSRPTAAGPATYRPMSAVAMWCACASLRSLPGAGRFQAQGRTRAGARPSLLAAAASHPGGRVRERPGSVTTTSVEVSALDAARLRAASLTDDEPGPFLAEGGNRRDGLSGAGTHFRTQVPAP
jgi:hypothetical protein